MDAASGTSLDLQLVEIFPLYYQIPCIVLTALFVLSFAIWRNPTGWRRLYQSIFAKPEDRSINKNKQTDERVKRYGVRVSMCLLLVDVVIFVLGVTSHERDFRRQQNANWNKADTAETSQ